MCLVYGGTDGEGIILLGWYIYGILDFKIAIFNL